MTNILKSHKFSLIIWTRKGIQLFIYILNEKVKRNTRKILSGKGKLSFSVLLLTTVTDKNQLHNSAMEAEIQEWTKKEAGLKENDVMIEKLQREKEENNSKQIYSCKTVP